MIAEAFKFIISYETIQFVKRTYTVFMFMIVKMNIYVYSTAIQLRVLF